MSYTLRLFSRTDRAYIKPSLGGGDRSLARRLEAAEVKEERSRSKLDATAERAALKEAAAASKELASIRRRAKENEASLRHGLVQVQPN